MSLSGAALEAPEAQSALRRAEVASAQAGDSEKAPCRIRTLICSTTPDAMMSAAAAWLARRSALEPFGNALGAHILARRSWSAARALTSSTLKATVPLPPPEPTLRACSWASASLTKPSTPAAASAARMSTAAPPPPDEALFPLATALRKMATAEEMTGPALASVASSSSRK
jgi:hypothetical protein